jgi:hypothetical protein
MKKFILLCILTVLIISTAAAQEYRRPETFKTRPLNEVKTDIGPLFVPLFLSDFMGEVFAETTGFGVKTAYDRMLSEYFSLGGEFAFITAKIKAESFTASINSIDAGIRGRFYPWKKFFYLQAMIGLVTLDFELSGTTGALEDFKEYFDPYTGIGGVFDIGLGWRWLLGRHFIIDTSIISGFYIGNTLSATSLFKLASGGIPALSGNAFPLRRLDAAIALGVAF